MADDKETADLLRKDGANTGEELKVTLNASNSAVSDYTSGTVLLNAISNATGTGTIGPGTNVDGADDAIAPVDASIDVLAGYIQNVGDTMVYCIDTSFNIHIKPFLQQPGGIYIQRNYAVWYIHHHQKYKVFRIYIL